MSTRANIFIRNDYGDDEKVVIYHHCDGYPEGVGKVLTRILHKFSTENHSTVSKEELANYICSSDKEFRITTPCMAGDAEYIYEINLSKRRVEWEGLYIGEQEWLCDF